MRRTGRDGFLRNVSVALGNRADASTVLRLAATLRDDPSPLVRGHAAWALGRIGGDDARAALHAGAERETDRSVREEIALALPAAR